MLASAKQLESCIQVFRNLEKHRKNLDDQKLKMQKLLESSIQADEAYTAAKEGYYRSQAGLLAAYQRDRDRDAQPRIPVGGELKLTARRWNVMLQNTTYVGGNLMPYFHDIDPAGVPYATSLYFGTPCYDRFFNLAELAWTPQIAHFLSLRLSARFYFNGSGFLGWQQICSLRFNLDALRNRDTASGRCL